MSMFGRYVRPILASRDVKASLSEQEAGVVAMEALHRQTLPFMMRRLKEDVLQELPPKIMQDYYCELSSVQKVLYEDFVNSQGDDFQDDHVPKTHVFQVVMTFFYEIHLKSLF
jgi:TATA-binding protein-associated factor